MTAEKIIKAIEMLNALGQFENEIERARTDVEKNAWKTIYDCRLQDAIDLLISVKGPITQAVEPTVEPVPDNVTAEDKVTVYTVSETMDEALDVVADVSDSIQRDVDDMNTKVNLISEVVNEMASNVNFQAEGVPKSADAEVRSV